MCNQGRIDSPKGRRVSVRYHSNCMRPGAATSCILFLASIWIMLAYSVACPLLPFRESICPWCNTLQKPKNLMIRASNLVKFLTCIIIVWWSTVVYHTIPAYLHTVLGLLDGTHTSTRMSSGHLNHLYLTIKLPPHSEVMLTRVIQPHLYCNISNTHTCTCT